MSTTGSSRPNFCLWGVRNACDKAAVCDWRWTARVRVRTCVRASALDVGRNYNIVIVFAEGA